MRRLNNPVIEKSFSFSVQIANCFNYLVKKDKDLNSIYDQLLRSVSSIGADTAESQAAASKINFRNKLRISLKETCETECWLKLYYETKILRKKEFKSMLQDCLELIKLLASIPRSTKTISI